MQKHEEYTKYAHRWRTMRGSIGGEDVLKGLTGEFEPWEFIPKFSPHDKDRYDALIKRAIYYNFTGNTHSGFTGAVFRKPQTIKLPDTLEYMIKNADGTGAGLEQVSREVVSEVLSPGRNGLLVDLGKQAGSTAYIKRYAAEKILDWAVSVRDSQAILTKVVLEEPAVIRKEDKKQYRFLMLDESWRYYQVVYAEDEKTVIDDMSYPTKRDGSQLDYIPFQFFGSENNRPTVDKPPLFDIANINIGHFRNSADWEEFLHFHGQGTVFITSEMSGQQFKEANPNGITIGARAGHFIGPNGNAILLQMGAESALPDAMDRKVNQMIGIGAQFIDDSTTQQTATGTKVNASQRTSGLSKVVGNVVTGMQNVLAWTTDFMGGDPGKIEYDLNRIFYDESLTAQEATAIIMLKDAGFIATSDGRWVLRRSGWLRGDRTDELIDGEVEVDGGM